MFFFSIFRENLRLKCIIKNFSDKLNEDKSNTFYRPHLAKNQTKASNIYQKNKNLKDIMSNHETNHHKDNVNSYDESHSSREPRITSEFQRITKDRRIGDFEMDHSNMNANFEKTNNYFKLQNYLPRSFQSPRRKLECNFDTRGCLHTLANDNPNSGNSSDIQEPNKVVKNYQNERIDRQSPVCHNDNNLHLHHYQENFNFEYESVSDEGLKYGQP